MKYRPSNNECERDRWIFLDNFSTSFWWNSVIKIARWFKLINSSNHLAIFLVEFRRKVVQESCEVMSTFHITKAMWNTMECKRDSFSGVLGGARETRWECVSHRLKSLFLVFLRIITSLRTYLNFTSEIFLVLARTSYSLIQRYFERYIVYNQKYIATFVTIIVIITDTILS